MRIGKAVLLLVLAVTLLLSSCTFPPEHVSKWDNEAKIKEVMESIKNGKREELAAHFSEYLNTEHYDELIADIENMYSVLGSDVISFDSPSNCGYTQETVHSGDITLYISGPDVMNVMTADGNGFDLYFIYTVVNDEMPENVGINQILVRRKEEEKYYGEVVATVNGNTEYGIKERPKYVRIID